MAAAAWLRSAAYGVIVEASKPDASYTDYARISTYSGLPTVLGWPMHEAQWRGTYDPQGTRQDDIAPVPNLQLGRGAVHPPAVWHSLCIRRHAGTEHLSPQRNKIQDPPPARLSTGAGDDL